MNTLRQKIERVKNASMFEIRERMDEALNEALAVFAMMEKRIQKLEEKNDAG